MRLAILGVRFRRSNNALEICIAPPRAAGGKGMNDKRYALSFEVDGETFRKMLADFVDNGENFVEAVRCADCCRHQNCLIELICRAAGAKNPYCCLGKTEA